MLGLAVALAVVLIAPSYDLLPTTLHDGVSVVVVLAAAVYATALLLLVITRLLRPADLLSGSAQLLAINCTRLC